MVEFGTSSTFRGWVRVRVLGYGFGVRGRKVKSRDCALASDLVRAHGICSLNNRLLRYATGVQSKLTLRTKDPSVKTPSGQNTPQIPVLDY